MVRDITSEGDFCSNQINDFSKSTIHGNVGIGIDYPLVRGLSDCEQKIVSENSLRNPIVAEVVVGLVSLAISIATGIIENSAAYKNASVLLLSTIVLFTLLLSAFLLCGCIPRFASYRKIKSSNGFVEMPSTGLIFTRFLSSFSNSKEPVVNPYIHRGKLYRNNGERIIEYLNAGECNICEENPKGKLEIKKTGNREYVCVCTQNPKHMVDFDFTKK